MLIAQEKKKKNIAEYLLYMWQLEDLFRAHKFDEKALYEFLIRPLKMDDQNKKEEIWHFYQNLRAEMITQNLQESGHREELREILRELSYLHHTLLSIKRDPKYALLFSQAEAHLTLLKKKSSDENLGDVEAALNGLYGLLILRLKKQEISNDTLSAMNTFSKFIAYLSASYHKLKDGDASLN